jgi:methylmalonyl-CoA/ethylmalonyl-CoA epimerase
VIRGSACFRASQRQDTIGFVMQVLRIRHLTIAVRDLDAARDAFTSLFGALSSDAADVEPFGARVQDLAVGEGLLQLAAPRDPDGALQRFIERRGEGVYTVALEVADLDAAVAELAEKGVRVSAPVEAPPGVRTAFVTMAATHGVSIQLVEDTAHSKEAPALERPSDEPGSGGPPAPAEAKRELDLTPDEWSDVD